MQAKRGTATMSNRLALLKAQVATDVRQRIRPGSLSQTA